MSTAKHSQVFNQFQMFHEIRIPSGAGCFCPIFRPWFLSKKLFSEMLHASRLAPIETLKFATNFYIRFFITVLSSMFEFSLLSLGTGIDAKWCRRDGSERQHDSLVLKWNIFSDSFFLTFSAVQSPPTTLRLRSIWIMIKFTSKWILLDGAENEVRRRSILRSRAWKMDFSTFTSELARWWRV